MLSVLYSWDRKTGEGHVIEKKDDGRDVDERRYCLFARLLADSLIVKEREKEESKEESKEE